MEEKRTATLIMSLTPTEKAAAVNLAEKCGLSLSELVRRLLAQATAQPVIGYEAKL